MEKQMKTLTKAIFGAAMLAGSALATAAPAAAQPGTYGDGVYGYGRSYDGYGDRSGYGDRYQYDSRYGYGRYEFDDRYSERYYRGGGLWRSTSHCTSRRFGRWRFDPYLERRVFVPYRWAVRSGALRDCMYTMNRYGALRNW
jgi:hypothetical protein